MYKEICRQVDLKKGKHTTKSLIYMYSLRIKPNEHSFFFLVLFIEHMVDC